VTHLRVEEDTRRACHGSHHRGQLLIGGPRDDASLTSPLTTTSWPTPPPTSRPAGALNNLGLRPGRGPTRPAQQAGCVAADEERAERPGPPYSCVFTGPPRLQVSSRTPSITQMR
jgi:hypothetical protein